MDGHFDKQATARENLAGLFRAGPTRFRGSVADFAGRIGAALDEPMTEEQWEVACWIVEPDAVEEGFKGTLSDHTRKMEKRLADLLP